MVIGTLTLLKLSWQDIFNKRMVDERQIYLIIGGVSVLVFVEVLHTSILLFVVSLVAGILVSIFCERTMGLGEADPKLILYMVLLFGMFMLQLAGIFVVVLLVTSLLYYAYNKLLCKTLPQPYIPIILIAWLVTWLILFNPQLLLWIPFKVL